MGQHSFTMMFMTSPSYSASFFILTLCSLLCVFNVSNGQKFLRSPAHPGQLILTVHLPDELNVKPSSTDDASAYLFEVTRDHKLHHNGHVTDMRNTTSPPVALEVIRPGKGMTYMRAGPKYTYTYDNEGILSLSVNELHLHALDAARYPGVFVDRVAHHSAREVLSRKTSKDLSSEAVPPRNATPRNANKLSLSVRQAVPGGGSCSDRNVKRELTIAAAFDHTFCEAHGSAAAAHAAILSMVARASDALSAHTCVQVRVVAWEGSCTSRSDPYSGALDRDDEHAFSLMRDRWETGAKSSVTRDAVLLFTGYCDRFEHAALGYYGGTCTSRGYAWINGPSAVHVAHRLGRLIGATYEQDTVMEKHLTYDQRISFSAASAQSAARWVDETATGQCMRYLSTATAASNGGTCKDAFSANAAMACMRRDVGAARTRYGPVDVTVFQSHGDFEVWLAPPEDTSSYAYYISEYARVISTSADVADADIRPIRYPVPRATSVVTQWHADLLSIPGGASSCCGQDVWIHGSVVVERHQKNDRWETLRVDKAPRTAFKFKWTAKCEECESSSFEPMSLYVSCPTCYAP